LPAKRASGEGSCPAVRSKNPVRRSHVKISLPRYRRGARPALPTDRKTLRPLRYSSSAIWQPD
jgi:hypothetical protein